MEAFERFRGRIAALHAPEMADVHLTLAQLKALYLVAATGPIRISALAVQLGTAVSTTSGVVDRLVGMQLLERVESTADRRQVLVSATPEALRRLEEMSELGRERMRDLLLRLPTTTDVATVERAVRLLADAAATITEDSHR
jgi:DNA-binding MarR family transcriptional regulator